MAYKKKSGAVQICIVSHAGRIINGINAKTGAEVTIFLKNAASDKMKNALDNNITAGAPVWLMVKKIEDGIYQFLCFAGGSIIGQQKKAERMIAYEALQHEIATTYAPVRSRSNRQSLVIGRAGLPSSKRTGTKIERALADRVDNSVELEHQRHVAAMVKAEKLRVLELRKLRKKYFYEREWFPKFNDKEWDEYLVATYSKKASPSYETDEQFAAALKAEGFA